MAGRKIILNGSNPFRPGDAVVLQDDVSSLVTTILAPSWNDWSQLPKKRRLEVNELMGIESGTHGLITESPIDQDYCKVLFGDKLYTAHYKFLEVVQFATY